MTKEGFKKELKDLILKFEKEGKEEIELYFAFFEDDLDKRYSWEGSGFIYEDDPAFNTTEEGMSYDSIVMEQIAKHFIAGQLQSGHIKKT